MEVSFAEIIASAVSLVVGALINPFKPILYKYLSKNLYWRLIRAQLVTFDNDVFARETIKYRFKNIFSNINSDIGRETPVLTYKNFQDTKLCDLKFASIPVLQTSASGFNRDVMKAWLDGLADHATIQDVLNKAPFIDAEYMFYYYILSELDGLSMSDKLKLHPGFCAGMQFDPFKTEKMRSLQKDFLNDRLEKGAGEHESKIKKCLLLVNDIHCATSDDIRQMLFQDLLQENLSSNSSDLSQMFWSSFTAVQAYKDDTDKFWRNYVTNMSGKRVHIVVDNFGIEFLCDLVLGYYLSVKGGSGVKVTYHVKHIPMFVSDVVENDQDILFQTLDTLLAGSKECANVKDELIAACQILKDFASNPNVEFKANYFWNTPFAFSEVTKPAKKSKLKAISYPDIDLIRRLFEGEDLVVVKGDLNYRRLVEDKLWNMRATTASKTKYVKCPLLVIRSCKSSVVLDCKDMAENPENKYGPEWRTDGRVGAILYFDGKNG